jgi:hypothetical protein
VSEWHSSKINCPRSHCLGLYHIFISLNDEGVMGKSRPKPISSYNVSSSALPIPPMLSSSRHPFRGQAFNCRSIDQVHSHITISAGSEKFPIFRDRSMNPSFFFLFWAFFGLKCSMDLMQIFAQLCKRPGLRLTHIPPGSLQVASFARMLSA